jgi:type II secretory ATPase GspE/PulE/Tfp pilus assembly ATPase PilB-like protein
MVRRICTNCRAPYQPPEEELAAFAKEMGNEPATYYHGMGCNLCTNTGYRGRIGIFEFLIMSEPIRKLLRNHAGANEIKTQAIAEGMVTMKQDGMKKVKEGITSISEVMRSVFSIN